MKDPCPVGYPPEEWRAHSTPTRTIYRLRLELADARAEIRRLEARVAELEKQVGPPMVRTLASIVPLKPMRPTMFPRTDGLDPRLPTAPGDDGSPGYRLSEDGAAIMSARSSGLAAFAMDASEGESDDED